MKKLSLLALAMALLVPITMVASADTTDSPQDGGHMNFQEEIDRTVTQLENGVQVTITSEDPEQVEKIQKRAEDPNSRHGRGGGKGGCHADDDEDGDDEIK